VREEILLNVTPREVRAALVENGVLQEVLIERARRRGLISNIYKGKVSRVLPGMQAAFVEVGLERTAFLHASDIMRRQPEGEQLDGLDLPVRNPDILDLTREGDDILVQVLKDPLGTKGARLTTFVTIPSRYLVYMPRGSGVGVSARIEDEEERTRLRDIVESVTEGSTGGYIVRTAAEGASWDALRADMIFLQKLWEAIEEQAREIPAGRLVHEDLPLALRVLRDLLGPEIERVRVDDKETCERMRRFASMFVPELADKIDEYTADRPIFDLYGVEDEIGRALDRKVSLKSGGYLVLDQTEAMTTVDVNTGAFVGHRNLEETIFKTNLEAAQAIARQIRLRNLGGIIIVDFIDMETSEHRRQVLHALEKALAADHARNQITEVSTLGLVEMTRKRTRESLEHVLCRACPTCEGRGSVKTAETVCYEIFREILRQSRQFEFQELLVLAHPEVLEMIVDEESASLAELEEATGRPIRLQAENLYAQDHFDVVPI
jgi:ribonuclease G